jgi:simple sugar transport system permease protein
MIDSIDIILSATFWAATLRIATPLIFGTMGELLCERAGVLNLGIEGIMTIGAMVGWMAVFQGADLWVGVFAAACAGAVFGVMHGLLTIHLGLSQHVTGLGITLLSASLSYFIYRLLFPASVIPPSVESFEPWLVPVLSELPILGPTLFSQYPLTYLAFVLVGVVAYILNRTPLGLAVRMVGENPAAAESQGINVFSIRMGAVVIGSSMMAIGGAFLTLAAFNSFVFSMVQGRGWVSIALVVFASWRPGKALLGAILFGAFEAFQLRLQQIVSGDIPYQIFLMTPYILSIVVLIVMSRRAVYPKALLIPYRHEEH